MILLLDPSNSHSILKNNKKARWAGDLNLINSAVFTCRLPGDEQCWHSGINLSNRRTFFSFFLLHLQTECSGLFELKLKYFNNERGVDNEGACCSGRSDPVSGNCIGACKTRFRACLKHYQAKIDPSSPCTFGNVITPVLEGNSLNLTERSKQVPFENPIRFPFEFGWPVSHHP